MWLQAFKSHELSLSLISTCNQCQTQSGHLCLSLNSSRSIIKLGPTRRCTFIGSHGATNTGLEVVRGAGLRVLGVGPGLGRPGLAGVTAELVDGPGGPNSREECFSLKARISFCNTSAREPRPSCMVAGSLEAQHITTSGGQLQEF